MADYDDEATPLESENITLAPGIEIEMPKGFQIYEALVVVKCLDVEGNVGYICRTTDSLTNVEAIGMSEFARTMIRTKLIQDTWVSVDNDDDED